MKKLLLLCTAVICSVSAMAQDFSIVATATKAAEADGKAKFTVKFSFGADVKKFAYTSYSGKLSAATIKSEADKKVSAKTQTDLGTSTSKSYTFSSESSKVSTVVVVGFDSEGNYTGEYTSVVLKYAKEADWKDCGVVQYTDGFMANYSSTVDGMVSLVKVQSIEAIPGYYRLDTPYGSSSPYSKYKNFTFAGSTSYMYVDATDANKVFIENYHTTGMTATSGEKTGPVYFSSKAGYNISKGKDVDESTYGTFDVIKGTITFPVNSLYYCWSTSGSISWSASNKNGAFKIAFPLTANMTIKEGINWGTFFAPYDVTLPTGVVAYSATVNEDKVVYKSASENGIIPANTPVVVYNASAVNENIDGYASNVVPNLANSLVGVLVDTQVPVADTDEYDVYFLQNQSGVVAWYKGAVGETYTVKANRAYLKIAKNAGAPNAFFFDDDATGINAVENVQAGSAKVYNLNGQAVGSDYKGIVIKNGKKFFNK